MVDVEELRRLLSLVKYKKEYNAVEGLDAFHRLLRQQAASATVTQFLVASLDTTAGRVRGGIAFVLASHYLSVGNWDGLESLCRSQEDEARESVFNALGGDPTPHPGLGEKIVVIATDAARDSSANVRRAACSVLQNQAGWRTNVSAGLHSVLGLLSDPSSAVRAQAACAVGNFAKYKYELSRHVEAVRVNLRDDDAYVREWNAWALWQLVRYGFEIGTAVHDLTQMLFDTNTPEPFKRNASRALLQYAKRSRSNAEIVKHEVEGVSRKSLGKIEAKFLESVARLSTSVGYKQ